jgi:hypothetical protein
VVAVDRSQQLADLLVELAPMLRARIRARRGRRPRSISTSEIYATVVRRTLDIEARDGVRAVRGHAGDAQAEPADHAEAGSPDDARQSPRLWALLHTLIDRVIGRADRSARRALAAQPSIARGAERAAHAADPADLAEREDLRQSVVALVEALDETDREIIALRLHDHEWAAIAARTGLSAAACRQRWHRLIERLTSAVAGDGPRDDPRDGQAADRR